MMSQTTIYQSQKGRQAKVNTYTCLGPSSDASAALQIPGSTETKLLNEVGVFFLENWNLFSNVNRCRFTAFQLQEFLGNQFTMKDQCQNFP